VSNDERIIAAGNLAEIAGGRQLMVESALGSLFWMVLPVTFDKFLVSSDEE